MDAIGQIHISVRDMARAVEFYRDVLGLELLFEVPGQEMAFFDCGGVRLYLGRAESPEFESHPLLYYSVEGIERRHGELLDRGVEFISEPHVVHRSDHGELWLAFFRDGQGNVAALMEQRPPPAA